jgi:hypothetical protein
MPAKKAKSAFVAVLSYACRLWASRLRFSIVQLQRLEARDISHASQKGKERLCGCPVLCLSPLGKPPPLFYCPAPGLRGTCHKPNRPRRQSARLHGRFGLCHPPLSKAPPLFYCPAPAARGSRHKPRISKRQKAPFRYSRLLLVASGRAASAFLVLNFIVTN